MGEATPLTFTADNPAAECIHCGGTRGQHAAWTLLCPSEWESTEHDETTCIHKEGHCLHWYDGEECCRCGAPEMTNEERLEYGMEPKPS